MAYEKQIFANGDTLYAEQLAKMEDGILEAVHVTEQDLTPEQKAQARMNIGIDEIDANGITGDVVAIANMATRVKPLDISRFEMGSLNGADNSTYHDYNRARTPEIQIADFDETIVAINGVECINVILYDNDDNFVSSSSWCMQYTIPAGTHYKLLITPDPYSKTATPLNEILENFYWLTEYEIVKRVEELAEGLGGSVPAYVENEAMRVIDAITAAQTERTLNIAALSDWHVYTDGTGSNIAKNNWAAAKHAIRATELISNRIKLDAVACLGDYITGDTLLTEDGWLNVLGTFNGYMNGIKTDSLIKTVGNHDVGYGGSVFIPPVKSRPYIAGYNDHMTLGNMVRGYGYKDLPNHKVRLVVLNTCEFNNAADYSKSFLVSNAQYAWFAKALDVSAKEDASQWQILILSHHPLDWSGSIFPSILYAYEKGGSVSVNGTTFNYGGKNAAGVIGNIHGHLHNMLNGMVAGTSVNRWCVPNICYDYSNTYTAWKESTTYEKTAGTVTDTAFYVFCINLDTGTVNRIHYGAGYSDSTSYADGTGGETTSYTNLVESSIGSDGKAYNGGLGFKDGYRLNSSGAETAMDGRAVTGFIPATVGDVIRAADIGWNNSLPESNYVSFYDSNFNMLQSVQEGIMRGFGGSFDIYNSGFKLTMLSSYGGISTASMAYIRISGAAPGANFVVTKNEEIM